MLVFFLHGVNTTKANYANALINNIKRETNKAKVIDKPVFYASFWGNLFNNKKHQIVEYIQKDFSRACEHHTEYKWLHCDIYRYQKQRNQVIGGFLGDFLIYQNPKRGQIIRAAIVEQFHQFLKDYPEQTEVHFLAHSLGSLILWDLLFSDNLVSDDAAFYMREKFKKLNLISITTLGSPLLFLKEMLDLNFSTINSFIGKSSGKASVSSYKLRWVNIIHSSDLVAYPLKAAIEDEIGSEVLFSDQYVWTDANRVETMLHLSSGQSDLAMVAAAEDAHSAYFYANKDGAITGRIVASNLIGNTEELLKRCVTPR